MKRFYTIKDDASILFVCWNGLDITCSIDVTVWESNDMITTSGQCGMFRVVSFYDSIMYMLR